MTYRSKPTTNIARQIPCRAQFEHDCTGRWVQDDGKYLSVPAHGNGLELGRGLGHKTPDCFFAAVCPPAHDFIDGRRGGWDKETKRSEWWRAYVGTQVFAWENGLFRTGK